MATIWAVCSEYNVASKAPPIDITHSPLCKHDIAIKGRTGQRDSGLLPAGSLDTNIHTTSCCINDIMVQKVDLLPRAFFRVSFTFFRDYFSSQKGTQDPMQYLC